jgi:hypothetical protein
MTSKVWEVMNDLEMMTSKICSAREIIDTAAEAIQKNDYDKAETLAMAAYEFLGYYLDEFDAKFKLAWKETVVKQKKEEDDAWDAVNKEKEYYEPSMPPWGHSDLEYLVHHKEPLSCDKDDPSSECKGAWNSFWEENYYSEEFEETLRREGYEYTPLPAKETTKVDDKSHSEHYYDYTRNDPNRLNPFIDKVVKWQLPVEMHPSGEAFVIFPDDLMEAANLEEGDTVEWIDRGDGSYVLKKVTQVLGSDEC